MRIIRHFASISSATVNWDKSEVLSVGGVLERKLSLPGGFATANIGRGVSVSVLNQRPDQKEPVYHITEKTSL